MWREGGRKWRSCLFWLMAAAAEDEANMSGVNTKRISEVMGLTWRNGQDAARRKAFLLRVRDRRRCHREGRGYGMALAVNTMIKRKSHVVDDQWRMRGRKFTKICIIILLLQKVGNN